MSRAWARDQLALLELRAWAVLRPLELRQLALLALELPKRRRLASRRLGFLRSGGVPAEGVLVCQRRRSCLRREELASPSSAWLHLPATVELAACFPRPLARSVWRLKRYLSEALSKCARPSLLTAC